MELNIGLRDLRLLLTAASELSAKQTLCTTGQLKPYLSKAEAYRLFGRASITKWLQAGLLTPRKDGDHSANWRIDRMEAEYIKFAYEFLQFTY